MKISRWLSLPWSGHLGALALTLIVTGIVALVREAADVSNISMLYLLAVLASAVAFGTGPAITASVASFLAFDFFFIEPQYTFTVSDGAEWVALGLLLVTGMITGQLAAALRGRVRAAERREREAVVLYDVVRLVNGPDLEAALTSVAERLCQEMDLAAVVIDFDRTAPFGMRAEAGDSEALARVRATSPAPASILGTGQPPTRRRRGSPGRWIRLVPPTQGTASSAGGRDQLYKVPVNAAGRPAGSLVLVRRSAGAPFRREDDRLLSAIASQLGLAVERLRLREQATQAEVLHRADELKTALLNAVSHDLRTPLSSIIASAGSLLQTDVAWTEQERGEFARAIEDEAQRLNRLVGNLLDLSRIEAGSLRPDKGWYDPEALVDDVLGRLRPVTASHRLVVDVSVDLPPVLMDYVEIDEALSNLIENAAKYTPLGTEIRVAARRNGDELEVEVSDRGAGIPEDALPRLFEPFFRPPGPGQPAGMGLGLAVARGMVEAHGGRIRADNRPGGGAIFVFTILIGAPEDEAEGPARRLA